MNEGGLRLFPTDRGSACSDAAEPCTLAEGGRRLGIIAADDAWVPDRITELRVLGHGRAAEARLVAANDAAGNERQVVEKVFRPGLLTRTVYRAAFQAPFGYQHNVDAILASFYRRRVAARLVETFVPEARVAEPLYARWDRRSQALVLASEFIRGRGIMPAPPDPAMVRRAVAAKLRSRSRLSVSSPAPAEEIHELLEVMSRLETMLVDCGLTGSGWQVCRRAMVSTANLLRTETGYVAVDLESGIPAVLVPLYLRAALQLRSIPLFDDLDPPRLRTFVKANQGPLSETLGSERHRQLERDVEQLIDHSQQWKSSEPAVLRRPTRLLTAGFRGRYRQSVLDSWTRRRIVDQPTAGKLADESRFFSRLIFLLGCIPGRTGRFFQRLCGNAAYRTRVARFLSDRRYRAAAVRRYVRERAERWRGEQRIAPTTEFQAAGPRFVLHACLAKVTPRGVHRWLADSRYRRNRLARMALFCLSGRFQSEFGKTLIRSRIERWQAAGRLRDDQAASLVRGLGSGAVEEYVRCFGLHVGLKLFLPVVMPLKVGGAAASVASGNPFYFLFMLMLLPLLRTAVTLWRMTASGHRPGDYRDALVVGLIPMAGSLAYPVQMYAKFPALSLFLIRDFASRLGCIVPIYGGKDSRTELALIKSVNVLAEAMELWLAAIRSPRSAAADVTEGDRPTGLAFRSAIADRIDRAATKQLRLIAEEMGLSAEATQHTADNHSAADKRSAA